MASDSKSGDLPDILKRYVRQETVEPLRALGRFLGFGAAGSVLMGAGAVLVGIGALRFLQGCSAFEGSWSWAPYLIVALALIATIALLGSRVSDSASLGGADDR
ncbi:MAG: hypothetical protein QF777_06685 [Acidimicrobiales bacterium]|jgi:hypothetical protein|nr:hypothetical protein [Acidimicrobiales bacterium]MDP6288430.1 hypothetical protein [Acidimicrobiales bacterium]MDP6911238.1 hypothetical protein [Acidimicrobiales bacterium]